MLDLFGQLRDRKQRGLETETGEPMLLENFVVTCSYLEIYNERRVSSASQLLPVGLSADSLPAGRPLPAGSTTCCSRSRAARTRWTWTSARPASPFGTWAS